MFQDDLNSQQCNAAHKQPHLVDLAEVFLTSGGVGLHGRLAGLPAGWADLAVLVGELEGLDETQRFVDVASHRKVVDCDLTQLLLRINDEQAAEAQALVILKHTIGLADSHRLISQKRHAHLAQTSHLSWPLTPGQMGEVRVCRAGNQLASNFTELLRPVVKGDDFGRANEREVQWIKEQNYILALVVFQGDILECIVNNRRSSEVGSRHLRLENHF